MANNWSYLSYDGCASGHLACYFRPFALLLPEYAGSDGLEVDLQI